MSGTVASLTVKCSLLNLRPMNCSKIITIETGKPCIRGIRVTVSDVLGYLGAGISGDEVLLDFPYLS